MIKTHMMTWLMVAGGFTGLFLLLALANRLSTPSAPPTTLLAVRSLRLGDKAAFGVVALVYPLLLLALDRFWGATLLGVGLIILLWAGNRLKVAILSEALVFSDVFLAGHALRYPRLYFGYAPGWVWPLLIVALGVGGWGLSIEAPLGILDGWGRSGLIAGAFLVFLLVGRRLSRPSRRIRERLGRFALSFDAQTDVWAYTPLGAALLHLLWHGQYRERLRERFTLKAESDRESTVSEKPLPHRLLIQAESFVPLHQLTARASCTPTIDRLMAQASSGALLLDWRGAYTMRTEFAVLTGIAPRELETYGFDPYRLAAMRPMQSMAWKMKKQGYRTVVCHPNDGRFFERCRVMKHLGFDELIDLQVLRRRWPSMADASAYCGRYIHDKALLTWAADYLRAQTTPTFLFVITMEAHGPWDKSKFPGAQKLTEEERYETHLGHLDEGVSALVKAQEAGLRASVLMYGDHLPGLRLLRERKPPTASSTCWVAWGGEGAARGGQAERRNLRPEALSRFL
ncbi:Sulfatase [gut metagenome]|uniref:Sulfatase n=1 Tax=gut metagenome TaxID=749906 RepID=J9GXG1_9ZZZZ